MHPERTVGTASVAKLFALVELARRLEDGSLDPSTLLDRRDVARVGDSGLWQHLRVDRLPLVDVATLVGATSDNLATNVLVDLLGLDQVQRTAALVAPGGSTLHDVVRDQRGPSRSADAQLRLRSRLGPAVRRPPPGGRSSHRRSPSGSSTGRRPTPTCPWWPRPSPWTRWPTPSRTWACGCGTRPAPMPAYARTSDWSAEATRPWPTPCCAGWDEARGPTARRHVLDRMRATGDAILAHLEQVTAD